MSAGSAVSIRLMATQGLLDQALNPQSSQRTGNRKSQESHNSRVASVRESNNHEIVSSGRGDDTARTYYYQPRLQHQPATHLVAGDELSKERQVSDIAIKVHGKFWLCSTNRSRFYVLLLKKVSAHFCLENYSSPRY